MDGSLLRTTVADLNTHAEVFWARFGVLDEDIEIPLVVKNARVDEFILWLHAPALPALLDELC